MLPYSYGMRSVLGGNLGSRSRTQLGCGSEAAAAGFGQGSSIAGSISMENVPALGSGFTVVSARTGISGGIFRPW